MKEVYVFLITGFEEIEALATVDILRRGAVNVKMVSLTGEIIVVGSHQISVVADLLFEEVNFKNAELLVLPGGTINYNQHEEVKKEILDFAHQGNNVAAICASPMVLGGLGLLQGKNAISYPGFEKYLKGATLVDQSVVVDGNITTGKGPGLTFDFALKLVEIVAGKEKSEEVAKGLLLKK
jgi:4-methyl-5(b-hydroxyethyl)-thiazole monophosphate biosynthesis